MKLEIEDILQKLKGNERHSIGRVWDAIFCLYIKEKGKDRLKAMWKEYINKIYDKKININAPVIYINITQDAI